MSAKIYAGIVAALLSGCATGPPSVNPETWKELQAARSVDVKVEYWPGLREFATRELKSEIARCGAPLAVTEDQGSADLTVHYVHLQAICLDCSRPVAPDSYEVRILQGTRELVRWTRPNIGCGAAECMVTHAMKATAKLLCQTAPPN